MILIVYDIEILVVQSFLLGLLQCLGLLEFLGLLVGQFY